MTDSSATAPPHDGIAGTDAIRARFPAMEREVDGVPVAYFDGPGGTQVPTAVADAVRDYLLHHNGNSGWRYATSLETTRIVAEARSALADFFGGRPDEVAFGPSMTTLTLRVSRALGRTLEPGDRVVVTELDHHANVDPWKALADERGAEIRTARLDPRTGTLDPDDLADAIAGARIVAITGASNALGTMPDLATAVARAREAGATIYVDAVHYAPHALPDVAELGADFVAVSPYKFYGPHLGALWGRRERLEALRLPRVASAPDCAPDRVETGTLQFEALAGATAAIEFLASLADGEPAAPDGDGPSTGRGNGPHAATGTNADRRARLERAYRSLHARGEALFRRLWEGLEDDGGVTLYGPPPGARRTPTLGFTIDGTTPEYAAGELARQGLFVTHGDFYATSVIDRLGVRDAGGLLRAGIVAYTTTAEIDRLVAGVRELSPG
ncbi:MAG: cysteine desulfurase-like protein [Candidatus Longimicrobiales bacterium M2_2A_002]